MVVPSLPAHGFGEAGDPSLEAMTPSWYKALYEISKTLRV